MKLKYCLPVMLLLLLSGNLRAQNTFTNALTLNDEMLDVTLTMVNYGKPTPKLSSFKSKLIILDFWATWCTNCLHSFPFLDSVQNKLKDSIQVILVNSKATTDDVQKITKLFRNIKAKKGEFLLPSAIYDTVLDKLFPHTSLPHYVWLYNNRIIAITSSKEVNASNIRLALNDNLPALKIKNDAADTVSTMYAKEDDAKLIYGSILTQFDSIKGRKQGVIETVGSKTFYFINTPVINLYENALQRSLDNNFLLDVADSAKYLLGNAEWDDWQKTNTYCYKLTVPETASKKEIYIIMLQDLNRYLGLNGRFEKCLTPAEDKPHEVFVLSEKKCLINH